MVKGICSFSLLVISSWSNAQTSNDDIIAKLASGYGGNELTSINAITIYDYRKVIFLQQSAPSDIPQFWRFNEELTIDFQNKRKALISWRVNHTNKDLEKYIVDENSSRIYDILHKKYTDDDWYNFANTGESFQRTSDTLIAKTIMSSKDKLKLIDEVQYRGSPHFIVEFPVSGQSNSQVYINQNSGLITKVTRKHPSAGELTYVFSNHTKVGNIAFARELNFFVADNPRTVSTYRHIDTTPNLVERFAKPKAFVSWGEALYSKDMVHNQLASGVYHVGKGYSRALFIDAGEYFISIGGDAQIANNFESLQQQLSTSKPLKFSVLTHHHSRQLGMVEPALGLGAKVVTVKNNLSAISNKLNRQINDENVVLVNNSISFMNENITIFDIATAHADQNLIAFLNKEKILYAEDHYEILYKTGNPRVFENMVTFASKIQSLGIDAQTLVNGSSSRVLSIKEFKDTINAYAEPTCPKGYRVCKNG